jgi:hypothetical protein
MLGEDICIRLVGAGTLYCDERVSIERFMLKSAGKQKKN